MTPLEDLRAGNLGNRDAMELLYLVPRLVSPRRCVEIGSGSGFSASLIGQALLGTGGVLVSVDVEDAGAARSRVAAYGYQHVSFRQAKGAEYLAARREPIDFAFEDAQHDHEGTLAHLEGIHRLLVLGGVILVHDTNGADARRGVHDFTMRHPEYVWTEIPLGVGYMVLMKHVSNTTG